MMHRHFAALVLAFTALIVFAGCEGILSLTTGLRPASPSRVEVLDLTAGATELEWRDNATNEASYEVQRLDDGETAYVTLASVDPDVSNYTDTQTESGAVYSYRVRAANEFGASDWTNSPKISPAYLWPTGDTFGAEAFQYDIVAVSVDPTTSTITIGFDGPVFPADSTETPLVGAIEIDVDNNSETGAAPIIDLFGPAAPPAEMGVEYSIDMWDVVVEPDGTYTAEIVDLLGPEPPRIATITYGSQSVSIRVPSIEIDFDDGDCTVAVVIGTDIEPTDEAGPMRVF